VLVVKPKLSKEERLQRRQMRDAMLLKRMLNRSDAIEPRRRTARRLRA
jgi:hypothetical protein